MGQMCGGQRGARTRGSSLSPKLKSTKFPEVRSVVLRVAVAAKDVMLEKDSARWPLSSRRHDCA